MDQGIYIAASGSLKQEKMMEIVANNLANANNDGFKRDLMAFEAVGSDFSRRDEIKTRSPAFPQDLETPPHFYPAVAAKKTDFTPGQIINTGNPLDVAIEGKGFFEIKTADGARYMRSGSFRFNEQRQLITPDGKLVMGDGGPITIMPAAKEVTIGQGGQVIVGSGTANVPVGRLKIVDFADYEKLEKTGGNLYKEIGSESSKVPASDFKVLQGSLETSNVNVAREMVRMIEVTRGYESYKKVIQTIDGMNNKAVNEVGRVT